MNIKSIMDFPYEINCTDKDGIENRFLYNVEKSNFEDLWTFRIVPADKDVEDWFEFAVTRTSENKGKVTQMKHQNMPEYIAKGIPDKMIEESSSFLGLEIISSTNIQSEKSFDTEWRTHQATKVWTRLVAAGKAVHDSTKDIFTYTGDNVS